MTKEYDLDKLGTVLAIQNQITKDTLDMLREQQKRQVRMIWSSMGIVAMAIMVVGLAIYCTFSSLDKLTDQVNTNREMIIHNQEVLSNAQEQEGSQGLSQ